MGKHMKQNPYGFLRRAIEWLERTNWKIDEADEDREQRALRAVKSRTVPREMAPPEESRCGDETDKP